MRRVIAAFGVLFSGSIASADVVVEDLQYPPGEDWGPPSAPPEPHARIVGSWGLWAQGVRFESVPFRLGSTEIGLLDGAEIGSNGASASGGNGGLTLGVGYRPLRWLRLPEIRFSIGSGPVRGPEMQSETGLILRPQRLFVARFEVLAGIEYDFEHLTPFARGYAAYGLATLRVEVEHPELGIIGYERARRGNAEVGVEAGLTWHFDDHVGASFAYRYAFVGGATHGAMVMLAIRGKDR